MQHTHLHKHPAQVHRQDVVREPLYVITPVFNPERFRTRWKLYTNFERHVLESGAHLIVIEASFGEREEVFKEKVSEHHTVIHVRTPHQVWLKENLINVAMQSLPSDWKYMAWIDADIEFIRPDWVGETIHKLQHYHIIQMFSMALDLSPIFEPYAINYGFIHDYLTGVPDKVQKRGHSYYESPGETINGMKINRWHPGFAWAARRDAITHLGGLIDWAILGAGDHHMARALIGQADKGMPSTLHPEYRRMVKVWEQRALDYIKKNVGYMEGTIVHFFHGAKKHRKYASRWKILTAKLKFQPSLDLKKDWNGLWQLTDHNIILRDEVRQYFRERNEDSIDM